MISVLHSLYHLVPLLVTTPSPHYPQYLHSQAGSPSNPHPAYHRHKSSSESQPGSDHASFAKGSGSLSSPMSVQATTTTHAAASLYKSTSVRPPFQPSISLTSPVVDQVSIQGKKGGARMRGRATSLGGGPRPLQEVESTDFAEFRTRPQNIERPRSYVQAVGLDMKLEGVEEGVELAQVGGDGDVATEGLEGFYYDKKTFPVS